ncbi:HEPN domain-containing protein [uncultured Roseobacter sp.]|uniref:HEPN domain-containing protein n=1 Tax=uncultured Roseobacter sp. TaxID=114847 RepID=UPI002603F771|nr:HEPN domain-containing protein [uncultured Roseobacter sp.]
MREAKAYLKSARSVHANAREEAVDFANWTTRNPMFFLLLHATELAAKACLFARGEKPGRSHDIVELIRLVGQDGKRGCVREAYRDVPTLRRQTLEHKWAENDSEFAKAALKIEIEAIDKQTVGLAKTLKVFGALGQSKMTKLEFGKEVENWWHALRYPRLGGTTSYPDFDECAVICQALVKRAEAEIEKDR